MAKGQMAFYNHSKGHAKKIKAGQLFVITPLQFDIC